MNCQTCGSPIPEQASSCPQCGAAVPGTGAAPTAPARRLDAVLIGGCPLARLGDRFLAQVLDGFVGIAAFLVIGMWVAVRWGGLTPQGFSMTGKPALIAMGLTLLAGWLYFTLMEGLFSVTLGKALIGIQVRAKDGGGCTLRASLVRNLLRVIDAIAVYLVGLLVAVFSKLRQRVGDHVAKTVVVERPAGMAVRILVFLVWLGLLGSAGWGAYRLRRTSPPGQTPATAQTGGTTAGTAVSASASASLPFLTSGDFKLVNFAWLQGSDGPPRANSIYAPGDDLYTKYELTGYTTDKEGNIRVDLELTVSDPAGVPVIKPWTDSLHQTIANNAPITGSFHLHLPPFAPAGTYKLGIAVQDRVKDTKAQFSPEFQVKTTQTIAPATQLEVRDFEYAGAESGPALSAASYELGQGVYYRFKLFGEAFDQADRANVHIAYRLLSPSGEVLLDRPQWATVNDNFTYHPATFFVPITGNISLPSNMPKGTYIQRWVISDEVAKRTLNYESKFVMR